MDKFHHHKYLQIVADEDVRFVVPRDTSYGASWKKDGGKGAWGNLKRKWDRMVEILREPEPPHGFSVEDLNDALLGQPENSNEWGDAGLDLSIARYLRDCYLAGDIFAFIGLDPTGADGTMLDQVRDLRRYLLLVEAEMMARGVVPVPAESLPYTVDGREPKNKREERAAPHPEEERRVPRYEETTSMPYREKCVYCGNDLLMTDHVTRGLGGTYHSTCREPERPQAQTSGWSGPNLKDDNKHASLVPWAVATTYLEKHYGGKNSQIAQWFYRVDYAPGLHVLEPYVALEENGRFATMPGELLNYYDPVTRGGALMGWLVRLAECPPDAREWFLELQAECNAKEHGDLPEWQQGLYNWDETQNKYRIHEAAVAWTGGAP